LDLLAGELVSRANTGLPGDDNSQSRINYVMNGLQVTNIWYDVLYEGQLASSWGGSDTSTGDLSLFVAALLGLLPGKYGTAPYPGFLESRQDAIDIQNQGRNFTHEILSSFALIQKEWGHELPTGYAPIYLVTYGYRNAANAKMFGYLNDERCMTFLNLGARNMLQPDTFEIAIRHETWHCFHRIDNSPRDLRKLTFREGVVTYLTSTTGNASYSNPDVLFWSFQEWQAAEERKRDILLEYAKVQSDTNPQTLSEWTRAGVPLSTVPGAPSRCGYYVGLLAYRAYVQQQQEDLNMSLSAYTLLELADFPSGREEIWKALVQKEGLSFDGDGGSGAEHLPMLSSIMTLSILLAGWFTM